MNKFGICNKCDAINVVSLKKELEKIDPNATIEVRCQNLCGIGRTKPFVVVNHIPVIASSEQELIEKVKQKLED